MNAPTFLIAADGRLRSIWRFLAGLVVFYVALNLASVAASPFRSWSFLARELVARSVLAIVLAAGFSLLLVALDRIEGSPLAAMGLPFRKPAVRDSVLGFGFGAGMITLAVVAVALIGHLSWDFTLRLPAMLKPIALVTAMLAVGAISEEIAFRGYPFQRLVEAIGATSAVVVTSGMFAAVHLGNPHATVWSTLNTAAVGVLFALAYLKTKSLWLPWGMHFGWNLTLGVVFGLPVSGITRFSVTTHSTIAGPLWLTGGDYGIEASATGTAVVIIGILVLVLLFRSRPNPQDDVLSHGADLC